MNAHSTDVALGRSRFPCRPLAASRCHDNFAIIAAIVHRPHAHPASICSMSPSFFSGDDCGN